MIRENISFLNRFVYLFWCKWVSFLHIFMYIMWVLIVCRGKKRASDPLRLKLLVVVSCHLYVGSCNQVLCNSNKCSWLLTKSDFQIQLDKIFLSNNIKLTLFFYLTKHESKIFNIISSSNIPNNYHRNKCYNLIYRPMSFV